MPRDTVPSIVGLVPARAGSKRVKNKNIKPLGGHPVMAYTIASAVESGIFGDVIVSTSTLGEGSTLVISLMATFVPSAADRRVADPSDRRELPD